MITMMKERLAKEEPLPDAAPLVHEKALHMLNEDEIKRESCFGLRNGSGSLRQSSLDRGALYVVCVDIDPSSFKLKHHPLVDLVIADLNYNLPFRGSAFDVASAIEVIEHLFNVKLFVEEVHRVLKLDGVSIVTAPNVEHILSRLYFLFTGRLWHFFRGSEWKHVTPIFSWKFKRLIQGFFTIEKTTFNRVVTWPKIPLLRGKPLIPTKNPGKLPGEIWIFKLRKSE